MSDGYEWEKKYLFVKDKMLLEKIGVSYLSKGLSEKCILTKDFFSVMVPVHFDFSNVEDMCSKKPVDLQDVWLESPNGRDVTKRAIIDVNSIVSGQNYDILISIIAKLLTSRPLGVLSHKPALFTPYKSPYSSYI